MMVIWTCCSRNRLNRTVSRRTDLHCLQRFGIWRKADKRRRAHQSACSIKPNFDAAIASRTDAGFDIGERGTRQHVRVNSLGD